MLARIERKNRTKRQTRTRVTASTPRVEKKRDRKERAVSSRKETKKNRQNVLAVSRGKKKRTTFFATMWSLSARVPKTRERNETQWGGRCPLFKQTHVHVLQRIVLPKKKLNYCSAATVLVAGLDINNGLTSHTEHRHVYRFRLTTSVVTLAKPIYSDTPSWLRNNQRSYLISEVTHFYIFAKKNLQVCISRGSRTFLATLTNK